MVREGLTQVALTWGYVISGVPAGLRLAMWVARGGGPMVSLVESVQVARRPVAQLEQVIGGERHTRLVRAAEQFRQRLGGRTVWNVSSTAVGGGVAEMLHVLAP